MEILVDKVNLDRMKKLEIMLSIFPDDSVLIMDSNYVKNIKNLKQLLCEQHTAELFSKRKSMKLNR